MLVVVKTTQQYIAYLHVDSPLAIACFTARCPAPTRRNGERSMEKVDATLSCSPWVKATLAVSTGKQMWEWAQRDFQKNQKLGWSLNTSERRAVRVSLRTAHACMCKSFFLMNTITLWPLSQLTHICTCTHSHMHTRTHTPRMHACVYSPANAHTRKHKFSLAYTRTLWHNTLILSLTHTVSFMQIPGQGGFARNEKKQQQHGNGCWGFKGIGIKWGQCLSLRFPFFFDVPIYIFYFLILVLRACIILFNSPITCSASFVQNKQRMSGVWASSFSLSLSLSLFHLFVWNSDQCQNRKSWDTSNKPK